MSFRSGPIIKLLAINVDSNDSNDSNDKKVITLQRPSIFHLTIALVDSGIIGSTGSKSVGSTESRNGGIKCDPQFFVKRRDKLFNVVCDRDVEELGNTRGEECLYITNRKEIPVIVRLSQYQLTRNDVFVHTKTNTIVSIKSNEIHRKNHAKDVLTALKTEGFFRIQLNENEMNTVTQVFDVMRKFTKQSLREKLNHTTQSIGSMQPPFGYRQTKLNKEYFVCRKIPKGCEDILQFPNVAFQDAVMTYVEMMGKITQNILKTVLDELGCDEETVDALLKDTLKPGDSLKTLGFTSMTELFRYNCEGYADGEYRYRVPCGDHQDVSLFTVIPKCLGPCGLEVFNWKGYWEAAESNSKSNECIVFGGELLHRITAGKISPASHRVVVPVVPEHRTESDEDCDRFSCPFELLLHPMYTIDCEKLFPHKSPKSPKMRITQTFKPTETSQDYISRISQKLVSVNK